MLYSIIEWYMYIRFYRIYHSILSNTPFDPIEYTIRFYRIHHSMWKHNSFDSHWPVFHDVTRACKSRNPVDHRVTVLWDHIDVKWWMQPRSVRKNGESRGKNDWTDMTDGDVAEPPFWSDHLTSHVKFSSNQNRITRHCKIEWTIRSYPSNGASVEPKVR